MDRPALTVMAAGMGDDSIGHWYLSDDGTPDMLDKVIDKPPYRVPSMEEVRALPWNGLSVASTFAGCGGSSLGYRMAGFRVFWASEFIDAARDCYAANKSDWTTLDGRDIRIVHPNEIIRDLMDKGLTELDVLDGSPPCASFSTAGKRQAHWGQAKKYSDKVQRTDDLFHEYVRILRGLRPKVFVAENVSGLVKGVAKGYFLEILAALKESGYRVEARVLDAQWLGVPQQRQRVIFIGVRSDLTAEPAFPDPLPYRYSVRDAIPWIVRHGYHPAGTFEPDFVESAHEPAPAIQTAASSGSGLCEVNMVSDGHGFFAGNRRTMDEPSPAVRHANGGGPYQCMVETRRIMSAESVKENVAASIEGYAIEKEWDKLHPGQTSDKYLNLVKTDPSKPCPTVTAAGATVSLLGAPGGVASITHPTEKRKFTIAELKRICSFPDDFVVTGTYAQQWERLGRAVPPLMMRSIAEVIRDRILLPLRDRS